jgi:serine protease Do
VSRYAICSVVLALCLGAPALAQTDDQLRKDINQAREKVYPALVNISVVARQYAGGRAHRGAGAGSGVIVSPQGHVLTNFHVAGHTVRLTCGLPNGDRLEADVIAHDPLTDLSVLKLRLDGRTDPLPVAKLGRSGDLKVGDYVLAMGNPLSLSSSLTLGVVSNTGRVFTNFQGTDMEQQDLGQGEVTGLFTRWIQHDALILPGNSGGPLVSLAGEVIGINELGGNGVGFAIPSDLAAKVLQQVLEEGAVTRGWLGMSVFPVDKLGRNTGALVASVVGGSPADTAGLVAGDYVLALNGKPVSVRFMEQVPTFYQQIAELRPGKTAEILIERDGKNKTLKAPIKLMEAFLGEESEFKAFGLTAREITGPMALVRRFPDTKGVLLTGLRPGKPFELIRPRLQRGDVIRTFDGKAVENMEGFAKLLEAAAKEKSKDDEILVAYRRGSEDLLTLVKPPQPDPKKSGGELRKAWLGVKAQVLIGKLGKALGLDKTVKGFRVTQVYEGTEAHKGGIKVGDIIVSVDGDSLEASRPRDSQELRLAIEDLVIGETTDMEVLRDGAKKALKVKLQESPSSVQDAKVGKNETFEFAVRELTFMDRVRNRWSPTAEGVLVVDCTSGGWANMAGLRGGDLVIKIGDDFVKSAKHFEDLMAKVAKARPRIVKLFVRRKHRTNFVLIQPDWPTGSSD